MSVNNKTQPKHRVMSDYGDMPEVEEGGDLNFYFTLWSVQDQMQCFLCQYDSSGSHAGARNKHSNQMQCM